MTTCTTLDLGDGITQSTDFADGRCEVVFLVDGDIVATSYVDAVKLRASGPAFEQGDSHA